MAPQQQGSSGLVDSVTLTFLGEHKLGLLHFHVFPFRGEYYWVFGSPQARLRFHGPFPTAEGAYLDAIGE